MTSLMRDDLSESDLSETDLPETDLLISDGGPAHSIHGLGSTLGMSAVIAGSIGGILGADLVPAAHAVEALIFVGVMSILALVKVVNIFSEEFSFDEEEFNCKDVGAHNFTAAGPSRRRPFSPSVKEFVVINNDVRSRPGGQRQRSVDQDANPRETFSLENIPPLPETAAVFESDASSDSRTDEPCSRQAAEHDPQGKGRDSSSCLTDTVESNSEEHLRSRLKYEKKRLSQAEAPSNIKATAHHLQFHDEAGKLIKYAVLINKKSGCPILKFVVKGRRPQRINNIEYDANSCVVWNGSLQCSVPQEDFLQVMKGLNLLCKVASVPLVVNRLFSPAKLEMQGFSVSERVVFPLRRDSSSISELDTKEIDSSILF